VVTIVPMSTSAPSLSFRPRIEVAGAPTVFLVDQVRAVGISSLHDEPVGYLPKDDLAVVEVAVCRYLGLVLTMEE